MSPTGAPFSHPTLRLVVALVVAALLGACQTFSDVKPGLGDSITIADHSYDRIWDATLKIAEQHFTVREQSKEEGFILAERKGTGGAWIGIYFTGAGADNTRVEVVRMGKYVGQVSWSNWPRTVLRELQASLGEPPAR